jgi:hypothetical protein
MLASPTANGLPRNENEPVMAELSRTQLKRSKGWRMPPNTVKVDRTTRWGNNPAARAGVTGAEAVRVFGDWVEDEATPEWKLAAVLALQGKRLACWCRIGAPCHADFLLGWIERASAEIECQSGQRGVLQELKG